MHFDKKVRFGEQLNFKMKDPEAFSSELNDPKPIEFKGGNKQIKKDTAAKQKKKPQFPTKNGYFEALQGKSKQLREKVQQPKKPLPEFNLDTRP